VRKSNAAASKLSRVAPEHLPAASQGESSSSCRDSSSSSNSRSDSDGSSESDSDSDEEEETGVRKSNAAASKLSRVAPEHLPAASQGESSSSCRVISEGDDRDSDSDSSSSSDNDSSSDDGDSDCDPGVTTSNKEALKCTNNSTETVVADIDMKRERSGNSSDGSSNVSNSRASAIVKNTSGCDSDDVINLASDNDSEGGSDGESSSNSGVGIDKTLKNGGRLISKISHNRALITNLTLDTDTDTDNNSDEDNDENSVEDSGSEQDSDGGDEPSETEVFDIDNSDDNSGQSSDDQNSDNDQSKSEAEDERVQEYVSTLGKRGHSHNTPPCKPDPFEAEAESTPQAGRRSKRQSCQVDRYVPPTATPPRHSLVAAPWGVLGWAREKTKDPWWPARIYASKHTGRFLKTHMVLFLGHRTVGGAHPDNVVFSYRQCAMDYRRQIILPGWKQQIMEAMAEAKAVTSYSPHQPEYLLNRRVLRSVDGVQCEGVVTSYDSDSQLFEVNYEDGQFAEYNDSALQNILSEATQVNEAASESTSKKRALSETATASPSLSHSPSTPKPKKARALSTKKGVIRLVDINDVDADVDEYEEVERETKTKTKKARKKGPAEDDEYEEAQADCSTKEKQSSQQSTDIYGLVGRPIVKKFDGVDYEGVVASYRRPYFRIQYTDGDEEEMGVKELKTHLFGCSMTPKMKKDRQATPPSWQIAGGSTGNFIGNTRIAVIELHNSANAGAMNFYSEYFSPARAIIVRQALNKATSAPENQLSIEFICQLTGVKYSLMGVRIAKEQGFKGITKQYAEYMYVAVKGGVGSDMNEICLKTALERVANFAALPNARKTAKRLELFASKAVAKCPPCRRKVSEFEIIDEPISAVTHESMGDGCGFISDDLLAELLGNVTNKNNLAIQVRVFGPRLGVFKGMLCRKPGITGVQLTPSMRKVGPSVTCSEDWVSLVVVRTSPSSTSNELARIYRGGAASKSFRPKTLSPMIMKVWEALGVPRRVVLKYERRRNPRHTGGFVGLADPTNALPSRHIFVTGVHNHVETFPDEVFITRSPCVRPEDARLLPVVHAQPAGMSDEHWEWMLSLPFGGVMFSTQGEGVPLPMICAAGDLDGDLYFLCWDESILSHITPRAEPTATASASVTGTSIIPASKRNGKGGGGGDKSSRSISGNGVSDGISGSSGSSGAKKKVGCIRKQVSIMDDDSDSTAPPATATATATADPDPDTKDLSAPRSDWFTQVQRHLVTNCMMEDHALISKIYMHMSKIHESSSLGMDDPDAISCANAYLASIDRGKHGIEVLLPPHLRKQFGL
jgi:hypothetical protein